VCCACVRERERERGAQHAVGLVADGFFPPPHTHTLTLFSCRRCRRRCFFFLSSPLPSPYRFPFLPLDFFSTFCFSCAAAAFGF